MGAKHQYKTLYSNEWRECNSETASIFTGNPSIKVRQINIMRTVQDFKDKIDSLINNISHYKLQADEMLFLKQEKERELEQVQREYFELVDKGYFNIKK